MIYYTQAEWLLLFFLYCFLGWVWETVTVSARKRKWVNRGFLYGPWLPIYGSGAIIILFTTLPVRESLPLIFIVGMISATILEYVTGAAMEQLFHMRYWDYSNKPLNVNGHICLGVSLGWGCFSIGLIKIIHPPLEKLVLAIPSVFAELLSLVLAVLFVVDVTKSTQSALDFKELLAKLSDGKKKLEEGSVRFNAAIAQMTPQSTQLRIKLQELKFTGNFPKDPDKKQPETARKSRNELLLERLQKRRDRKSGMLMLFMEKTELALQEISAQLQKSATKEEQKRLEGVRADILNFRTILHKAELEQAARRDKDFKRAVSILERNPSAVSKKYQDALSEIGSLKQNGRAEKEEKIQEKK